jgi:mannose-6-phosphate isomerase-like protein (cupin superfamily)
MIESHMTKAQTRRNFLRTAPLAAVTLPLAGTLFSASPALAETGQSTDEKSQATFQLFPAATIDEMVKGLQAAPAAKDIVSAKGLAVSMTVSAEEKKIAKEFEFHEHRDHVFQVLDGATVYEVGGSPQNARQTKPGEWLAPHSEGFTSIALKKGDMLVVPRMTPHRRVTEVGVSLLLINATTPA